MHSVVGGPTNFKYFDGSNILDLNLTSRPLIVLGFGYFVRKSAGKSSEKDEVRRLKGRKDYQLIYLQNGHMTFKIDGKELLAPPNTLVLYRPGVPQIYKAHEECTYYYIHFTGSDVEKLLEKYEITETVFHFENNFKPVEWAVKTMESERSNPYLEDVADATMLYLLPMLAQAKRRQTSPQANEGFASLLQLMEKCCGENISVETYASHLGFSTGYFIRFFKKHLNVTPQQYLARCKLQTAERDLLSSTKPINQISEELGFCDVHYFYNFFKRHTGFTPSEYRKSQHGKNE